MYQENTMLSTLYQLDEPRNLFSAQREQIEKIVKEKKAIAMQAIIPIDIEEQKLLRRAEFSYILLELLKEQYASKSEYDEAKLRLEYQKRIAFCLENTVLEGYNERLKSREEIFEDGKFISLTREVRATRLASFKEEVLREMQEYCIFPDVNAGNIAEIIRSLQQEMKRIEGELGRLVEQKVDLTRNLYHKPIEEANKRFQDIHHMEQAKLKEAEMSLASKCEKGDLAAIKAELEHLTPKKRAAYFAQSYKSGCYPLHIACSNGQVNVVEYLLAMGAEVNQLDMNGSLPIHHAATNKEETAIPILNALKAHGADLNAGDRHGRTILHISCNYNSILVAQGLLSLATGLALIDKQTKETRFCQTALHVAASKGHHELVHLLLRHGANPKLVNIAGQTAIMDAAICNHGLVVQAFLDFGVWFDLEQRKILRVHKEYASRIGPLLAEVLKKENMQLEPDKPTAEEGSGPAQPVLIRAPVATVAPEELCAAAAADSQRTACAQGRP